MSPLTALTGSSQVDSVLRMANYPVGLGNSRISILVTDDAEPQPVVMTIYTVHMTRESRPSLPMFGDHVTCSFVQVSQLCCRHDNIRLWRSSCDRVLVQDQDPGVFTVPV